MNGRDAIVRELKSTQRFAGWYIEDLTDEELLVRPVPGANHIAWQLGHLILAEQSMIGAQGLAGVTLPELPAGFREQHAKDKAADTSNTGYATRSQYLDLFRKTRKATIAGLEALSDAELERPSKGEMAKNAPQLADMFLLQANHTLLHVGQFTIVRRKLGKPVLF